MRWLLLVCYPLLSHFALMRNAPLLEWIALMVLFGACFYEGLSGGRKLEWLGLVAFAAAVAGLLLIDTRAYALYLPPLVFPVLALLSFAVSLLPGREPLVTTIAAATSPQPLPPPLLAYTRAVTWAWTLVLIFVLSVDAAVIALGTRELWSLWANFVGYGFIFLVFLIEYGYRRLRFRHFRQPPLLEQLRSMRQARAHVG